jgi:hypothetical protein
VNEIKEKASEAEAIVATITKDIQKLDLAKRNMTKAIVALRRWNMLRKLDLSIEPGTLATQTKLLHRTGTPRA